MLCDSYYKKRLASAPTLFKIKNMKKLPRQHLSASQVQLWTSDQLGYMKKYFLGITEEEDQFLRFGKNFAEAIQYSLDGNEKLVQDYVWPQDFTLPCNKTNDIEYELLSKFDDFSVIAYFDVISKDRTRILDYKTGQKAWDLDRLKNSLQMKIYSLLVYREYDILPEVTIEWHKTRIVDGKVQWANQCTRISHTFTKDDLMEMLMLLYNISEDISDAYTLHLDDEIDSYVQMYVRLHNLSKQMSADMEEIRAILEDKLQGKRYVKTIENSLFNYNAHWKTKHNYSAEVIGMQANIKKLMQVEEELGITTPDRQLVTTITIRKHEGE